MTQYTEQGNEKFNFFCALNKSVDCKVLFSKVLDYPKTIKKGTRLIIKSHKEKDQFGKPDTRYRLFLDESQAHAFSGRDAS